MGKPYFWIGVEALRYTPPVNILAIQSGYTDSKTGLTATTHNLINVPAGALLVLMTGNQNSNGDAGVTSSPSLTWTKRIDAQGAAFANAEIWTAVYTAGGDIDVTSDWGGTRQASTIYVVTGQETTLQGASVTVVAGQAAPSLNITSTRANSLLFVNTTNWNAITGSRTYRGSATEDFYSPHAESTFFHYHYTALTQQSYTVGFTAPNDIDAGSSTVVLEIRPADVFIPDTTPPSAPVLSSPSHSTTTVALTWTASTDNVAVAGYDVYVEDVFYATTTNLSLTVTGLTHSSAYDFKVRARDTSGNYADSNVVNVTTNTPGGGGGILDEDTFTLGLRTDDFSRPWGGAEMWNKQSNSVQTASGVPVPRHFYRRYTWLDIENNTTKGVFNWSKFDQDFQYAITNGMKFAFGIITMYPYHDTGNSHNAGASYGGGVSAYPLWLHNLMQADTVKDWKSSKNGTNDWVPNYNGTPYKDNLLDLYEAIYNHIQTTSYTPTTGINEGKTIDYKDAMAYTDIRGHGSWGEWHSNSVTDYAWNANETHDGFAGDFPVGTKATIQTMKDLIDMHVDTFTDWPCVAIINIFDHLRFRNTYIDNEVGIYVLTKTNTWGKIGLRRDQWGDNKDYYRAITSEHDEEFSPGVNMSDVIMARYQEAPFVGEPPGYVDSDTKTISQNEPAALHMGYLDGQIDLFKPSIIGNGNYSFAIDMSDSDYDDTNVAMRANFKKMGSRLQISGGTMELVGGGDFTIGLDWREAGVAPQYGKWDVVFQLKTSGGAVVWEETGTFDPHLLQPSGTDTNIIETFADPALAVGTYNLYVVLKDKDGGYWEPYPLNNTNRQSDGSYFLCPVTWPS